MKEHIEPESYQEAVAETPDSPLVESLLKLKKPPTATVPQLKPRAKMEQVCLVIGFNAAIDQVVSIVRRHEKKNTINTG